MSNPVGRPREFSKVEGLEQAMLSFWRAGYDAVSVRDLSAEIGIGQPSLYAAYGSKAELYLQALKHYEIRFKMLDMSAITEAASEVEGVMALLTESAQRFSRPGLPRGCFVLSGCVADIPGQRPLVLAVRDRRRRYAAALYEALSRRFAKDDALALSRLVGALLLGMSQQARDGASLKQLQNTIDHARLLSDEKKFNR